MSLRESLERIESRSPVHSTSARKRAQPGIATSSASSTLACKKCRARKVKASFGISISCPSSTDTELQCDAAFPVCSCCAKAGVPCIVADYTTSRDYTRSEVSDLEERLRQLEAALGYPKDPPPERPTRRRRQRTSFFSRDGDATSNGPSPARYVGREAGVEQVPWVLSLRNILTSDLQLLSAPFGGNSKTVASLSQSRGHVCCSASSVIYSIP